jgi:hypothetical protein
MKVYGEEIKVEATKSHVVINQSDWELGEHRGTVIHKPTGNIYGINVTAVARERESWKLGDITARLLWVDDGKVIPTLQSQAEQGRAAIVEFLMRNDLWQPDFITEGPERPEDQKGKRLARGLHN